VETSAKQEGLPIDFLTRLIWRESAFRTHAISAAGAIGVAQFMPGTASDRGLADPFDPATAIPASAKLLAELEGKFGNLGFAAAAYDAGPTALSSWLAGKGAMRAETQDYVLATQVTTPRNGAPPRGPPLRPRPLRPALP
jgi:soluble lytic murein transglycosylase-like protein